MRRYNFTYFVSQGIKSIGRNWVMTVASVLILVSCMLVIGSFWIITINIDKALSDTDELFVLKVHIADSVADGDGIKCIEDKLSRLENVKSLHYVTREEAFENVKKDMPEISDFLAEYNPMGRSFDINFSDADSVQQLIYNIKSIDGVEKVQDNISVYNGASDLKKTLTYVCGWMMAILLVVALLVIMNTVKITIFARRKEIAVMRYIGATGFFICAPFFVEGVLVGLISAAAAFGVQYYLYWQIVMPAVNGFSGSLIAFGDIWLQLALAFAAVGVFAGIISTAVSIKKYLNK